jgi:hypothetical protein
MPVQVSAAIFRPLRLNFAQICIWCERRWCESAGCVTRHDASWWAVCDNCDGSMVVPGTLRQCSCLYGVQEVTEVGAIEAAAVYGQPTRTPVRAVVDEPVMVVVGR